MKILVFTEGTVLMHSSSKRLTREQRVEQSKSRDRSIYNYKNHIPVGNAVNKLNTWKKQKAEIYYLTSRTISEEINSIRQVLIRHNFPDSQNLYYRKNGEAYKDVAERLSPDVLVEDDCESIGGEVEMTYPHIKEELKKKIKSVVVKEFGGIDHLSDSIENLIK
jgi:hypothetical protein